MVVGGDLDIKKVLPNAHKAHEKDDTTILRKVSKRKRIDSETIQFIGL